MPHWLSITLLILFVLALGVFKERWRFHQVTKWTRLHGGLFHWNFTLADHPGLPAAELAAKLDNRGAHRWAAAVQGTAKGCEAWVMEYEDRGTASQTGRWFCLCLIKTPEATSADAWMTCRARDGARWITSTGSWVAERRPGLLSTQLLDEWFS